MEKNKKPNLNRIVKRRQNLCYDMVDSYRKEILGMINSKAEFHKINNKIIDLRNHCVEFIHSTLTELTSFFKYNVELKTEEKKQEHFLNIEFQEPCQICNERRASNVCHIIPRSHGGRDESKNLIILCPTHHFLFDHSRLSRGEFETIDTSMLSDRAKEYFEKVHRKKHELKWRYSTNRFSGCDCGSIDFEFVPFCHETYFTIALRCLHCGETWLNLWEQMHPFNHAESIFEDPDEEITEEEKAKRLASAQDRIQAFIDQEVPRLLREIN